MERPDSAWARPCWRWSAATRGHPRSPAWPGGDNIRILRPDCDETALRRAVEQAALAEFVDALPDGLDTWVGEGGASLSGGQKQRIAIARVLLADPPLYIFDEATAALDTGSERHIQAALEAVAAGRTSIVIAHRLSTIRHVDRILVFRDGSIVQDGSWDELAGQPGTFQDLLAAPA
ncbi:MAG: ATP-binding cassette domain-containing protein [Planctomycetota bacterium]